MIECKCVPKLDKVLNKWQNINEGYGETMGQIIKFLEMSPEEIENADKIDLDNLSIDADQQSTNVVDIDTCK